MTRLLFLSCVLAFSAMANIPFNDDGENLYRLVRVDEPRVGEADPSRRIVRDVARFIEQMERGVNYDAHQRAARQVRDVFEDDSLFMLYQIFLHGVRAKAIVAHGDREGANSGISLTLRGKNAGLIHLQLMEAFDDWRQEIPDFASAEPERQFHLFDEFLEAQGVKGFAPHAVKTTFETGLEARRGMRSDLRRNWTLATSARRLAMGCALLVAGVTIGRNWQTPPPEVRIEKALPAVVSPSEAPVANPQKQADRQAEERGARAAEALQE